MKAWAYKNFKIGDLFTAQTGDTDLQQKDVNGKGVYLINSGIEAQGIKGKTDRQARVFKDNTITIDFWGNAYYRDFDYKMATHNHVFSLSGSIIKNRNVGLYLVSAMSYMRKLFSYNNMGTWTKIKELSILLPVLKTGEIDFAFMESRIREMEESRIREMEAYLKVAGFEDCNLTEKEEETLAQMASGNIEFKSFFVVDDKSNHRTDGVFYVNNSHNILQSSIVVDSGNVPYVTAGEGNNSVCTYISYDKSQIEKGNAIMIGGKTMVITYQAEDFFSNDSHNLVLYAKDENLRQELIQLYMVTSLNKSLKPIYSWGNSISKAKIKKDKFFLPVTSTGEIDYQFMETYIRAIEKLSIQKVKDWRAKEIDTTKNIVKVDIDTYQARPQVNYDEWQMKNNAPKMVAEEIVIPGSLEVRLQETKREELLNGSLDLVLMYAIGPVARKKTEGAGKIALGIKEEKLSVEAIKAYESINYVMFHYWKNSEARPFKLISSTRLVSKEGIPEGYLVRQDKEAKQYLLLEYDADNPADFGEYDILKVQRKGTSRYIPFVCKVDSLKE